MLMRWLGKTKLEGKEEDTEASDAPTNTGGEGSSPRRCDSFLKTTKLLGSCNHFSIQVIMAVLLMENH